MKTTKFLIRLVIGLALTYFLLLLAQASQAQEVSYAFEHWKNQERAAQIEATKSRFIFILRRAGFTQADSVRLVFDLKQEQITVSGDPARAEELYRCFILYAYELRRVKYLRLIVFRYCVKAPDDLYYVAYYNSLHRPNYLPRKINKR